ncbi:YibE/F family protein [Corynebacterium sp. CCM 8835]|uniref:YibE/F family protein n=1 Tax=Corynebacterium antarcticum TaxID=2800405 RepID=A0A9Q4CDC7_9CORY|nr:YibE/F family protein [Corynebacterium antarcticum]MCK7643242.1 YibE/F family protein [Corynebacterium antarcticum]MCK7661745.1 YibE/F family protein [Corynebacterium antarcticum]MCL0246596.1 YibE/F family protein [Corynebacterium antarcticum]MCX7492736.1 YibE/F family protein [Corynebacterium antarcticum]MCX7538770.1 YibE/F family protein [Corynebacterium antarcticum]
MGRHHRSDSHADPTENIAGHLAAHGIGPDGNPLPKRKGERRPFTTAQWILSAFLILTFLGTVAGLVVLWPSSEKPNVAPSFQNISSLSKDKVGGTVSLITDGSCNSPSVGRVFESSPVIPLEESDRVCEQAIIDITSGVNEGKRTMLMLSGQPGDPDLAVDERILLYEETTAEGAAGYTFADYQRGSTLLIWGLVTALGVVLLGSWLGARSLVGLAVTLAGVGVFLLPALLRGGSPLTLAVVCGSAVLFAALYLVHGVNWKTSSALGGTLIALGIAAVLAQFAIRGTQLRGLGSEDNLMIQLYLPDVSVTGLMLCGFIIGSLGVLNDVTISQASTVNELAAIDPRATPWRLFKGAIRVGRDHIASIMYTLVLSYTGAALPLLLLLTVADRPFGELLTGDIMATELLRSAVGALALTMSVPITTAIAAFTCSGRGHSHDH